MADFYTIRSCFNGKIFQQAEKTTLEICLLRMRALARDITEKQDRQTHHQHIRQEDEE